MTQPTIDRLLDALRIGATVQMACAAAGISDTTYYRWLDGNERAAGAVEAAKTTAAVSALESIQRAAVNGDWRAAAWLLERRYPADFGRSHADVRHTLDVTPAAVPAIRTVFSHAAVAAELTALHESADDA